MRSNARKLSNEIVSFAHLAFLRALSLSDVIEASDIVFHGGVSLKVMYQSSLQSEGLDFIIYKQSVATYNRALPLLMKDVQQIMMLEYPNMNMTWNSKINPETNVMIGTMKVNMQAWHSDIGLKIACYPAQDMTDYASSNMDIDSFTDLVFPTATLDAMMGDKMVALAMRPYFKARDAYDIWWMTKKGISPSLEHVNNACAVYGYAPADVLNTLQSIDKRMGSSSSLQKDLACRLSPELHKHFIQNGIFEKIRQVTIDTCHSFAMRSYV